jgi:glycogen operon protein
MLLMGDEVRRTQRGNNNAYCQDNETSWFDWTWLEQHADVHRFVRRLIHFRRGLGLFQEDRGIILTKVLDQAQFQWHGVKLNEPDWGHHSHSLAIMMQGKQARYHLMLNAYWEPLDFELPPYGDGSPGWQRVVDTYLEAPEDFRERDEAPLVAGSRYRVQSRSVVLLVARA